MSNIGGFHKRDERQHSQVTRWHSLSLCRRQLTPSGVHDTWSDFNNKESDQILCSNRKWLEEKTWKVTQHHLVLTTTPRLPQSNPSLKTCKCIIISTESNWHELCQIEIYRPKMYYPFFVLNSQINWVCGGFFTASNCKCKGSAVRKIIWQNLCPAPTCVIFSWVRLQRLVESQRGVFAGMSDWHLGRHSSDSFGIARHTSLRGARQPGHAQHPRHPARRTNQPGLLSTNLLLLLQEGTSLLNSSHLTAVLRWQGG